MLALSFLVACAQNDSTDHSNDEEVHVLEVSFEAPETVQAQEEVELIATVRYGDDKVSDANEVTYEIWEEGGKEDSLELEAINNQDGTYSTTTSFEKDGIYHVQVHVTARDQHAMPKKAITVGEGGQYEQPDEGSTGDHAGHDETDKENDSTHSGH